MNIIEKARVYHRIFFILTFSSFPFGGLICVALFYSDLATLTYLVPIAIILPTMGMFAEAEFNFLMFKYIKSFGDNTEEHY